MPRASIVVRPVNESLDIAAILPFVIATYRVASSFVSGSMTRACAMTISWTAAPVLWSRTMAALV